jgi:nitrogen-specific signal transduction histidine kinase
MNALLAFISDPVALLGVVVLAFAVGVRLTWGVTMEAKRLRARVERYMQHNNTVDAKQQEEINYVLKRVNDLMHGGKVKKITIKRRAKVK